MASFKQKKFDENSVSIPLEVWNDKKETNGIDLQPNPPTTDTKAEEEKDDKKKKLNSVGLLEIFAFADKWDVFLIIFGMIGAVVAGAIFPLMFAVFGNITTGFTNYQVQHELAQCDSQCFGDYGENDTISQQCEAIDETLKENMNTMMWQMCSLGVAMWLGQHLLTVALQTTAMRQVTRIRTKFLGAVLRQDIAWYDTNTTSDFASKMTEDLNKIQDGIGEKMGMLVRFITTFLGSLIYPFIQNWEISLVISSVLPLLAVFGGLMGAIMTRVSKNEMETYGKAGAIAEEVLSSIRTVIAFGGEDKEVKKYTDEVSIARKSGIFRGMLTGTTMGLMFGIIYGVYGMGLWYGVKMIKDEENSEDWQKCAGNCTLNTDPTDNDGLLNCIEGCRRFSIGSITVALFGIVQGGMQIGQSSTFAEAFNTARAAAYDIFQVIYRKSPIDSCGNEGIKPKELTGQISFKNVFFNYPARKDVKILNGLDLEVETGKTVALVGPSGCGKSTCIQLIQRFYDPDQGQVLVDGKDVKELNVGWLRNQIGIVGQEPVLFDCSIKDNIKYAKEDATDEEITKACQEANAYDFIQKLPETFDTMVGEGGTQLSGGQKQRIAIARALIRNPKILLLDEATSALDNESEGIVQAALDKVHAGRTTVVVAHRLTTIRNADLIVALKDGAVQEMGTHEELMKKKGLYYDLVESQLAGKDEEGEDDTIADLPKSTEEAKLSRHISRKMSRQQSSAKLGSSSPSKKIEDEKVELQTSRGKLLRRLMQLSVPEIPYIVIGCLGALVFGIGTPFFAILFGDMLECFTIPDYDEAMKKARDYALMFGGVGLAFLVSMGLQGWMFAISGQKLTERVRIYMFKHMLKQDMGWFDSDKNNTGALCARLSNNAEAISGATGAKVGQMISGITTLFFGVGLAIYYNWKLGLVSSVFLPPLCIGLMFQLRLMLNDSKVLKDTLEKSSKTAVEAINNIRTVAGLRCEERVIQEYAKSLEEPIAKSKWSTQLRGFILGFANSNFFFAYGVCYFYGTTLIRNSCPDELDIMEVFKVAIAVLNGGAMVGISFQGLMDMNKAFEAADQIFGIVDRRPNIDTNPSAGLKLNEVKGNVDFENAEFSYPTRKTAKVLRKLQLAINQGEKIALVGQSGCGKSTVIQLIQRFYDLDSGSLNLEQNDIRGLNLPFVRSKLGIVSQEPILFNCSIADNIKYGDNSRNVTMEEVIEAAKKSNIHNFVAKLPQGYDTNVGGKGTQLSGGQKQRIAIARALIRDPSILLLDEATSALDMESEKVVQEALESAQVGRTSITIAHRLSTIVNSDKIFVIHKGQVEECGTHSDLLEKKGIYYNLWNKNVTL